MHTVSIAKLRRKSTATELVAPPAESAFLQLRQSDDKSTIEVVREGETDAIITQVAKADHRPFLHPIVAPDGKGLLTEYSPWASQAPDRSILGIYAGKWSRLFPSSRRGLLEKGQLRNHRWQRQGSFLANGLSSAGRKRNTYYGGDTNLVCYAAGWRVHS